MHKFLVITIMLFSSNSIAMLTFDSQNFAQNMKIYAEQLNSLNQLKQQTEYHIAEYKAIAQQLKLQQNNMQHLNSNMLTDLYNTYNEISNTLNHIASITDLLSDLDRRYGDFFNTTNKPLPDEAQNLVIEQQLKQNIASNRRAINALKILKSQQQEQEKTEQLIKCSQQATGHMQAMQAANQLAAMQIKQLQDLKILIAQDLELRTAAVFEQNTAKVIAQQRFKQEMAKPMPQYKTIKLPNLKK